MNRYSHHDFDDFYFIVGTKTDLTDQQVINQQHVEDLANADERIKGYGFVSAKTGENVTEFFSKVVENILERSIHKVNSQSPISANTSTQRGATRSLRDQFLYDANILIAELKNEYRSWLPYINKDKKWIKYAGLEYLVKAVDSIPVNCDPQDTINREIQKLADGEINAIEPAKFMLEFGAGAVSHRVSDLLDKYSNNWKEFMCIKTENSGTVHQPTPPTKRL